MATCDSLLTHPCHFLSFSCEHQSVPTYKYAFFKRWLQTRGQIFYLFFLNFFAWFASINISSTASNPHLQSNNVVTLHTVQLAWRSQHTRSQTTIYFPLKLLDFIYLDCWKKFPCKLSTLRVVLTPSAEIILHFHEPFEFEVKVWSFEDLICLHHR